MFNYAFNIQLIYIQHSTRYSIFNFAFNFQLFILYSIPYPPIQLSIQQFQPFIQHSTIHSTFNYSFNSFEPSLATSGQWHRSLLDKNMAAAARLPATEIEAFEDDTRLHFDVESDFPRFLDSVLQRTDQISLTKVGWGNCGAAYCPCRSNGAFASYTQVYPETAVQ